MAEPRRTRHRRSLEDVTPRRPGAVDLRRSVI
jgi:hypothetical protein